MSEGFIGWREIKSGLIQRGEGVQLLLHNFFFLYMFFANQRSTLVLHNAILCQSWARSKSGLAVLLTFFNIKLLNN